TACGWVIVASVGIGLGISDFGFRISDGGRDRAHGAALATAALLYGALGLLDDRYGDRTVKGLRGHLRRFFRQRRVTTGFVKALGGAACGLVLSAWADGAHPGGAPL